MFFDHFLKLKLYHNRTKLFHQVTLTRKENYSPTWSYTSWLKQGSHPGCQSIQPVETVFFRAQEVLVHA